ncbi:hypothetical protein [Aestuariibaculum sediminum]|uniref:STAS/SEC14 domain-containing protein n=1 Tax=Aestuariibaculum sediminum TaxID=2770637 RepID=A0A8J6UG05_9FLAO|nr:hypothetical protein [Aestuariibaculum sediminum]MBD0831811.1 hypothetical protein [Aestuariibaculum sediminum]
MLVKDHPFVEKITGSETNNLGTFYFLENVVIAEFKDGAIINIKNLEATDKAIKKYFGDKNFALICNRIAPYSIDLNDTAAFNENYKNLKADATVFYSNIGRNTWELESQFFNYPRKSCDNIEQAMTWVLNELKKHH